MREGVFGTPPFALKKCRFKKVKQSHYRCGVAQRVAGS